MTSQSYLTSGATSETQDSNKKGTTDENCVLPKPTWPAMELRGSYYEEPMFMDWSFLQPKPNGTPKFSPSSLKAGSGKNSGRVSDLNSFNNSANNSRLNVASEGSEASTTRSRHTSSLSSCKSISSISSTNSLCSAPSGDKTCILNEDNSLANDNMSPKIIVHQPSVQDESETDTNFYTFAYVNVDPETNSMTFENSLNSRSKSADELECKCKAEEESLLGIYDASFGTVDAHFVPIKIHKIEHKLSRPKFPTPDIVKKKKEMRLPLQKVTDDDFEVRPRSKTFTHIRQPRNGGVDGYELMSRLEKIAKKINADTPHPNGKMSQTWDRTAENIPDFQSWSDEETYV